MLLIFVFLYKQDCIWRLTDAQQTVLSDSNIQLNIVVMANSVWGIAQVKLELLIFGWGWKCFVEEVGPGFSTSLADGFFP